MTDRFEEFRLYLPKYLSAERQKDLFRELDQFPDNIDGRLYTTQLAKDPSIFQGDGLQGMLITDLPRQGFKTSRVMVVSNTCDLDVSNKRTLSRRLMYCPVIRLEAYEHLLRKAGLTAAVDVDSHISNLRKQRNTSLFYLPKNEKLDSESIALLDRIHSCDLGVMDLEAMLQGRLFTLSDYGFYMFLFKISIHLTRVQEGVIRN